jgi:hypothetical protein
VRVPLIIRLKARLLRCDRICNDGPISSKMMILIVMDETAWKHRLIRIRQELMYKS